MKALLVTDKSITKAYMKSSGFSVADMHGNYRSFLSDSMKDVVIVVGGSGHKLSESADWLINNYSPDFLISIGHAMSLNKEISLGDAVFCSKITSLEGPMALWNKDSSYISEVLSSMKFNEFGNKILKNVKKFSEGNLLCANNIPSKTKMRYWIGEEFDSSVIDIDSINISRACLKSAIPFAIVRFVTVTVDEKLSVFDRRSLGEIIKPTYKNYITPSNIFGSLKRGKRRKKAMHDFNEIISAVGAI